MVDKLHTPKELVFAADAVTAKHELRGPRALQEIRQYLGREIELGLV